jgi:hypothetical protein
MIDSLVTPTNAHFGVIGKNDAFTRNASLVRDVDPIFSLLWIEVASVDDRDSILG